MRSNTLTRVSNNPGAVQELEQLAEAKLTREGRGGGTG